MNLSSAQQPDPPKSQSALRVAVADDDRAMRELLQHMLRKQGHEVVAMADTGEKLIKLCASAKPDVIITDNLMPDLDGADAAAIIYAERPTPIILLSGYCDRNLVLDAEQKHVLMYLVKPISDANLRAALARCRALLATQAAMEEPADESQAEQLLSASPEEYPVRSPSVPPYPQAIRPSQYKRPT
ncbi:MAG TPA: response regulator [Pirellulales bacterium]|jgi:CheY-like chemotaxis protein|nr:response regulator [Pirellulales bacterium]